MATGVNEAGKAPRFSCLRTPVWQAGGLDTERVVTGSSCRMSAVTRRGEGRPSPSPAELCWGQPHLSAGGRLGTRLWPESWLYPSCPSHQPERRCTHMRHGSHSSLQAAPFLPCMMWQLRAVLDQGRLELLGGGGEELEPCKADCPSPASLDRLAPPVSGWLLRKLRWAWSQQGSTCSL